jgi:hypothetical protein
MVDLGWMNSAVVARTSRNCVVQDAKSLPVVELGYSSQNIEKFRCPER